MNHTAAGGETIQFRKTTMILKTPLNKNNGSYLQLMMVHPPHIGPALHIHPTGPETFLVMEGSYIFTLNEATIEAVAGDFIFVPHNTPHKYNSGIQGGKIFVTTPEAVVNYFKHISAKLINGEDVPGQYEYEYAKANGQTFVDSEGGFGHK